MIPEFIVKHVHGKIIELAPNYKNARGVRHFFQTVYSFHIAP